MSETEKPTTAFILSLIGGIFILLGGGLISMMGSYGFGGMMNGFRGYGGMMSPGFGMMGGYGYGSGFGMLGILGVIFGVVVIVSALMLNNNPAKHSTWGLVIVIFSILSMFGSAMGGFGIGLVLGLIGGILALTWKPSTTSK